MSGVLEILSAGPGVLIQDEGRQGWMRYGVSPAGPMDKAALHVANRLLANAPGAAAVEISVGGLTARARGGPVALALAGGAFDARRDGKPIGATARFVLQEGQTLSIRAGARGAYAILALAGGAAVPAMIGSRAVHTRSGIGPFGGRGLTAGDRVAAAGSASAAEPERLDLPALEHGAEALRVITGPQDDLFADGALEALCATDWRIEARSDRMAYALDGPPLLHRAGHDIVSDGVTMGSLQIPGDGRPFALMADRQTTGGYPKIATIIQADLPALAQRRSGEIVRFRLCDHAEAARGRATLRGRVEAILEAARMSFDLTSERLLGLNLIGGGVDAQAPP